MILDMWNQPLHVRVLKICLGPHTLWFATERTDSKTNELLGKYTCSGGVLEELSEQ